MPVRAIPAPHAANAVPTFVPQDATANLKRIYPEVCKGPIDVLQSSFRTNGAPAATAPNSNGFVWSIIKAYNQHCHLIIRPEDLWFAILTQLSSYINAHAEELRSMFVKHKGQKELKIMYDTGQSRYDFDFGIFAKDMSELLEQNILDKDLRAWIMPDFSTSTAQDTIVASIIMMATMKKYFAYACAMCCGIPSVTLLGEKADYEKILQKLDKLDTFGNETIQFAALLRAILRRFIRTFEAPTDADTISFWERICDNCGGSGGNSYSGWLAAFCFWDADGVCLYSNRVYERSPTLDGVKLHWVDEEEIPGGWCVVPVTVIDHGTGVATEMVAGSVGIEYSNSGAPDKDGVAQVDTVQPVTGWWIYEKLDPGPSESSSSKPLGWTSQVLNEKGEDIRCAKEVTIEQDKREHDTKSKPAHKFLTRILNFCSPKDRE